MALVDISRLYSGGAQVFDTRSHLNFQARLLAQERAKQDALDAYYRRLPLTINEKGVRDQERPVISDSLLGIKKYYIENKDKIRQGDQAAAYNYEKMVREHQNLVGESQKEGLTGLQVGKIVSNPATAYVSQSKDFMDRIHAHSLPINDPNHVSLDIEELTLPPKPYDRTTYFKNFAQLKGNDNIKRMPNGDGTQTVINTPIYEEPQKEFVLSVAADKYLHDPSFTKMIDEDLGEANASNVLNEDFKMNFGHDIQTPIDLATAYTFNGLKPQPRTEKIQTDQLAMTKQRQAFELKKMGINDAYIRGRQRNAESLRETYKKFSTKLDAGEEDNILNKFNDISLQSGTNKLDGATVDHITVGGENYKGKFVEVPKNLKTEYRRISKDPETKEAIWEYPDRFYMTDDKKYVVPVFLGAETGTNKNKYIKKGSTPIPMHVWKKQLAKGFVTLKATGAEVTGDNDLSNDLEDEAPTKTTTSETNTRIKKWDNYKVK